MPLAASIRVHPLAALLTVCLPVLASSSSATPSGRVIGGLAAVQTQPATGSPPLVGDLAPELGDHVTWLRGDPVRSFEEGRVYLIDLWATWCMSCIARSPSALLALARALVDGGPMRRSDGTRACSR